MRTFLLIAFAGLALVASMPNNVAPINQDDLFQGSITKRENADEMAAALVTGVAKGLIKKVLNSEAAKLYLSKDFIEKFLNSDLSGILNLENFDLIINSDLVQGIVNKDVFKVIIKSKAFGDTKAKLQLDNVLPLVQKFISFDAITTILDSDFVVNLIDPEFFKIILESNVVKELAKLNVVSTKLFRAILNYKFLHYFIYSETGMTLFAPNRVLDQLNNEYIAELVTPANIKDLLDSPLVMQLSDKNFIQAVSESSVVKAIAKPEFIHAIIYSDHFTKIFNADLWGKILNTGTIKGISTPAVFEDIVKAPAFKSMNSPEFLAAFSSSDFNKNGMKNKEIRAAVDAFYHAVSASS